MGTLRLLAEELPACALEVATVRVSGFGATQRRILVLLKEEGGTTTRRIAGKLGMNVETIRGHLKALTVEGVVRKRGTRRDRPGRPEIVYGLTDDAERLFPNHDGEVLKALVAHLLENGESALLRECLERLTSDHRAAAQRRLADHEGRPQGQEAAAILSDMGFMARFEDGPSGRFRIRISHCPLRKLVEATDLPCRMEAQAIADSLGVDVFRRDHQLAGDSSCLYEWNSGDG